MRIKGVWADLHRLPPDQWVNVYRLEYTGDLSYFVACQVKHLAGYLVPIDELFLEPVTPPKFPGSTLPHPGCEVGLQNQEARDASLNF